MLWLWLAIIVGAGVTFLQEPLLGDGIDPHTPHATPISMQHRVCGLGIAVGPNALVDAGVAATVWAPLPVIVACGSPSVCGTAGTGADAGPGAIHVNGSTLSAAQLLLVGTEDAAAATGDAGRVVWVPGGVNPPDGGGDWPGAALATAARHAAGLGFACDYYLVLPLGATWDVTDGEGGPVVRQRDGSGSRRGPR